VVRAGGEIEGGLVVPGGEETLHGAGDGEGGDALGDEDDDAEEVGGGRVGPGEAEALRLGGDDDSGGAGEALYRSGRRARTLPVSCARCAAPMKMW
jgi:hypothetical protein